MNIGRITQLWRSEKPALLRVEARRKIAVNLALAKVFGWQHDQSMPAPNPTHFGYHRCDLLSTLKTSGSQVLVEWDEVGDWCLWIKDPLELPYRVLTLRVSFCPFCGVKL